MEDKFENKLFKANRLEDFMIPYYDPSKEERYINYKSKSSNCFWDEAITFVNIGLDQEFYTNIKLIKKPASLTVLVNKYNQLGEDFIPEDLEVIAPCFNSAELKLRHDARIAFEAMCLDAKQHNLHLEAISTFRSFNYQEQIYYTNLTSEITMEEYQKERDRVSARPGHSEHQTGLAVDINDLEQTFEETSEGRWLARNSYKYGYLLRYPKGKERITGYDYEPWHFRYLGKELAMKVHLSKLTYDEYYVRCLLWRN